MAYLRCTQCGSKALVAASQCPKCAQPFHLLDARGERAKLKRCRSCGIMHRVDAHCHWCGEVKSAFAFPKVDATVWRTAAGLALMLSVAGGVWRYAPSLRDVTLAVSASETDAANFAGFASAEVGGGAGAPAGQGTASGSLAAGDVASAAAASGIAAAESDSTVVMAPSDMAEGEIVWVPAVARTWVNVRSDASRGGEVVGVIKPAARAMLGTDRAGWRQVRSPDLTGWVDPRLFEADSLRTRGE